MTSSRELGGRGLATGPLLIRYWQLVSQAFDIHKKFSELVECLVSDSVRKNGLL